MTSYPEMMECLERVAAIKARVIPELRKKEERWYLMMYLHTAASMGPTDAPNTHTLRENLTAISSPLYFDSLVDSVHNAILADLKALDQKYYFTKKCSAGPMRVEDPAIAKVINETIDNADKKPLIAELRALEAAGEFRTQMLELKIQGVVEQIEAERQHVRQIRYLAAQAEFLDKINELPAPST